MHVDRCYSKQKGKIYHSILLRDTIRINKNKVKHITIINLTKYPKEVVDAIEIALKYKKELPAMISNAYKRKTGKSIGAVYLVKEIMKKLSIDSVLGDRIEGKLAKFQLISRTVNQGSRLSSIRMAEESQAICETLEIEEKISEDNLYKNLAWLAQEQRGIEKKLFNKRYKGKQPEIFLYDVTSSYFEGKKNALAAYGYNRDGKKGKMQVVAGLLCDEEGNPIAIRLFEGNTLDFKTVHEQVKQVAEEFGCRRVTFVGDRGMLKSKQIEELEALDFYYITAITKPQIEVLLKGKVLQMSLFDSEIKEVWHEGVRYILRRNPVRAKELASIREEKKKKIQELCQIKNEYLKAHTKARPVAAIKEINTRIKKLKLDGWLTVEISKENIRELILIEDMLKLSDESQLDGCYAIKSNLPEEVSKESIHSRYKDLKYVEQGFRTLKTDWLEIRPWYVRTKDSSRGHAFITMLSYLIVKYLKEAWKGLNITVGEGLKILSGLSLLEVRIEDELKYYEVPEPTKIMEKLLKFADVILPEIMPYKKINVYSRVKLNRKS